MTETQLLTIQDKVINILEKRFFSPQDVLYDYAGMNGEVILPTPEECDRSIPNGLSWHTPVSNGAFFNGDLLLAVVKIYEKYPSEKLAAFARRLLKGLFNLQDHAPVPAFIARGFGSDGKCCYLGSSNDQITPFLLGLRSFSESSLATSEERADCQQRMLNLIHPLRALNWHIPGARPGFERGNLSCAGAFDACHLMLAALILEKEGGEKGSVDQFLKDRFDIIAAGYGQMRPDECWYASHNFYIQRMLKEFYTGTPVAAALDSGLKITAKACLNALDEWKKRIPDALFSPDWHCMSSVWFEQKNTADAVKCASGQGVIWREHSPAVLGERKSTMATLSAAWIILFSEDQPTIDTAMPRICEALQEIPYEKLYHASMFFAVNVISEILCRKEREK